MKIIFITEVEYTERDHHRFGLDYLMEKNYDVEIWRVVDKHKRFDNRCGLFNGKNYHEYSNKQLKRRVLENRNELFYFPITRKRFIFPVMHYSCKYIIVGGMGAIPEAPYTPHFFSKLYYIALNRFSIKCVLARHEHRKYLKLIKRTPPYATVTSTQYASDRYLLKEERLGRVLHIHSYDYDRFLESRNVKAASDCRRECILYCDSGFFDEDYDTKYTSFLFETQRHRSECLNQLECLFDELEKYYGVPIVVAGHPYTMYPSNTFCGRKIVFGKIEELALNAKVFVLQTSTAISLALLNDLPILQVVNSYFKKSRIFPWSPTYKVSMYDYIDYQAEILGVGFLDMDCACQMNCERVVAKKADEKKRELYLKRYIIDNDTKGKLVIEYIEELIKSCLEGIYYE